MKTFLLSVLCGACIVIGTGCVSVKEEPQPQPVTTRTTTTESHSIRAAY